MTREGMNLIERYFLNWHDAVPYFQWEPGQPLRIEWAFEVVAAINKHGSRLMLSGPWEGHPKGREWVVELWPVGSEYGASPQDVIFAAAAKVARRLAEGK
jgi:hypothetical protein